MKNILESTSYVSGKLHPETILKDETKLIKLLAFDKGYHLKPHKANTDVLILVLEGKAKATVLNKTHELNPMDYLIFPKNEIHEVVATSKMKMLLVK